MGYSELKRKHQQEIDNFPMMFAFNNQQFKAGMAKLGLTENDTDKVYKFGNTGGFYRREDAEKLEAMFTRQEQEREEAIRADKTGEGFIRDMFSYELDNHEYTITGRIEDALRALDLTEEEVRSNPLLLHGLNLACKAKGGRGLCLK